MTEKRLSRQQLRHAEREAAKGPSPQPAASRHDGFVDTAITLSRQWRESQARSEALMAEIADRFTDPDWQTAMIAEARSWRELLDRIPGEAPTDARGVRASMVRWFAASTAVGNAIIGGIEAGDRERVMQAVTGMDLVIALEQEATMSGRLFAARRR